MMQHGTLSRKTLLDVIRYSQESIFVTDGEGTVILVNPVAAALMETPAEEMLGKNVRALMREGYYKNSAVQKALDSGKTSMEMIKYRDGATGISTSTPVFGEDGRIEIIVTNSSGEGRIKTLQDALEQERAVMNRYRQEIEYLRGARNKRIIAESAAMRGVLHKAALAAQIDTPVLIIGETGVGKDVIANYIHRESMRKDGALVDINCAAIPDALLEAELFGYERGAFTGAGAAGKAGLFELANHGTLFLDEISELPLPLQAKLLRVLENGEFRRIGGRTNLRSDMRILCATNSDPEHMILDKTFRADLFYRLNVLRIDIPPLRARKDDILPLAELFLRAMNEKYGTDKGISPRMRDALLDYAWPGNVRELRNVISRAYILGDEQLAWNDPAVPAVSAGNVPETLCYREAETLRAFRTRTEGDYIEYILQNNGGDVSRAADALGMHRSQLYRLLNRRRAEGTEEE